MDIRVEVRSDSSLSDEEREAYRRVRARIDYGEVLQIQFTSDREWRVLVWGGEQLASHVGISRRVVTVDGKEVLVGAVGGVWTAPEFRGQGFGREAMQTAAQFLRDTLDVEAGLLLCREAVVPFYERVGWQRVRGPLTFEQPAGRVTRRLPTLVTRCRLPAWPKGTIDLCGPPW